MKAHKIFDYSWKNRQTWKPYFPSSGILWFEKSSTTFRNLPGRSSANIAINPQRHLMKYADKQTRQLWLWWLIKLCSMPLIYIVPHQFQVVIATKLNSKNFQSLSFGTDINYIPASKIISSWLFYANQLDKNGKTTFFNLPLNAAHVEIIFQHENSPSNEWIPLCGYVWNFLHKTQALVEKYL